MKRLGSGALATLVAACCGLLTLAMPFDASAQRSIGNAVAQAPMAPPDFGSPPSGSVPILYNDHHVYTKPDTLKQGRVLAALVRNGTVLIPLRSMFEQMGASVSYDASSKTVTVSKPGAQVEVTVGKPEVVINGESRPLDVPPIIWQGSVLVPVRVISEGMGAYVQWVPDQHVVVVRYIPPTPPPPPPTAAPPPPPPPSPPPTPTPKYNEIYVAGDYIISPKVYNEFSPGNKGTDSFAARGAFEFDTGNIPWMIAGDFTQYEYPHDCAGVLDPQCYVTVIGGGGQAYVPSFKAQERDADGKLGIRVANPRIYIGVGYLWRTNNYGYPNENSWGVGAEKLPDLNQPFSVYASAWYYPDVRGTYSNSFGNWQLQYRDLHYQIGVTWVLGQSPLFIDVGWLGDSITKATNNVTDPSTATHNGPYAGIGLKFGVP